MSLESARKDWKELLKSGGFESDITFSTGASGFTPVTIKGLAISHHIDRDSDGIKINSKFAKVTISESELTDANYPVRNSSGYVSMKNHLVSYKDSTGTTKNFTIKETFPDETVGVIVCILGKYGS